MIGVFDSGVGGLTVVKEFQRLLPLEQIVYVGDTARVPWGNKSAETIQKYSVQICDFFVSKKITKIVIACNTASAVAGVHLRKKFKKVRFFDVIDPAVEKICSGNFSKVAVIGTRATIGSGIYQKKIKSKNSKIAVFSKECPLFVPLVEEGWTSGDIPRAVAGKYFQAFLKKDIQAIVLGCTHYPLLIPTITRTLGSDIRIINCATEVAKLFKQEFGNQDQTGEKRKKDRYYFTDAGSYYRKMIGRIMKQEIAIKKISFES